ncbi:erythroblast NAD(P)(+)--arginine ADP-ribosyltransferase-like [Sylvia borin]
MAPLAHTLALLAMAVATVAIKVVPLDMANSSFDDQYLECRDNLSENLLELQVSDFCKNEKFFKSWLNATAQWKNQGSVTSYLTRDQAIAVMAYTMKDMKLHKEFNDAVQETGSSSWKYRNEFHFKSLHFLLTRAVQALKSRYCKNVFRGVAGLMFNATAGMEVRFGQFTSTSQREDVAQGYGQDTMFKVYTCHGVDIQKYSYNQDDQEVLIPPFETFRVTGVSKEKNTMNIELQSTGTSSNYNCEWLKGGSFPRNSPHLGGLLLATVAMAVVTETL